MNLSEIEGSRLIMTALVGDQTDLYWSSPDFQAWVHNEAHMLLRRRDSLVPVFEAANRDFEERRVFIETAQARPLILTCNHPDHLKAPE